MISIFIQGIPPETAYKVSIKVLNLGDLCFSIYLLIVASVEIKYCSDFVIKENHSQSSILCKISLSLSLFSMLFTTFDFIAVYRVLVAFFPFKKNIKEIRTTAYILLSSFIFLSSIFCILAITYFYIEQYKAAPNVMCLMVFYDTNEKSDILTVASSILILIPLMYGLLVCKLTPGGKQLKKKIHIGKGKLIIMLVTSECFNHIW